MFINRLKVDKSVDKVAKLVFLFSLDTLNIFSAKPYSIIKALLIGL
ncbi:hypothetical protein J576_3542 [Acinetobacter sp. 766875]|nr:hypothetical protein ACIN5021_2452 [Acinetobacter sp. OIFC021]EXE47207.1 hypothetical protein J576_3542 [Acinetobacter sp. 766875]SSO20642.1 Uncharacterised protein [Acinetobacter nosocomialis]SSQ67929.1 Uncharacterised protein [Acinetobacter nosocomialis]SSR78060.1 Uncharacterised protein [Acinetobacter nosocomialis]